MKILFFVLSILFGVMTFAGVGYVLYTGGQSNAGFAVVPMALTLSCMAMYRAKKRSYTK